MLNICTVDLCVCVCLRWIEKEKKNRSEKIDRQSNEIQHGNIWPLIWSCCCWPFIFEIAFQIDGTFSENWNALHCISFEYLKANYTKKKTNKQTKTKNRERNKNEIRINLFASELHFSCFNMHETICISWNFRVQLKLDRESEMKMGVGVTEGDMSAISVYILGLCSQSSNNVRWCVSKDIVKGQFWRCIRRLDSISRFAPLSGRPSWLPLPWPLPLILLFVIVVAVVTVAFIAVG